MSWWDGWKRPDKWIDDWYDKHPGANRPGDVPVAPIVPVEPVKPELPALPPPPGEIGNEYEIDPDPDYDWCNTIDDLFDFLPTNNARALWKMIKEQLKAKIKKELERCGVKPFDIFRMAHCINEWIDKYDEGKKCECEDEKKANPARISIRKKKRCYARRWSKTKVGWVRRYEEIECPKNVAW